MKKYTIFKYKLILLLFLLLFLIIFGISTFKEGVYIKSYTKTHKNFTNTGTPTTNTGNTNMNTGNTTAGTTYINTAPIQPTITAPTTTGQITTGQITTGPTTRANLESQEAILPKAITIKDGNYVIYSVKFNNALSVYPRPFCISETISNSEKNESANSLYSVFCITGKYAETPNIWTIKTIDDKTTIQQNNCNYLILESLPSNPFMFTDPTTKLLRVSDNPKNIMEWKIIKDPVDSTYSIVPFNNQNINIYNNTHNYINEGVEVNMFINTNTNNNTIAKFIFQIV